MQPHQETPTANDSRALTADLTHNDAKILSELIHELSFEGECCLTVDEAKLLLDKIQRALDEGSSTPDFHRRAIQMLIKLSSDWNVFPPSLFISAARRVGDEPVFMGGFADIFKGYVGSMPVALKRMRVHAVSARQRNGIHTALCREALPWRQLKHPNILPFLGIDSETSSPWLCLVAPWVRHGNLNSYVEAHDSPLQEVHRLLLEVARGLLYLHSEYLVHGDLRGANILVDDGYHALLADFGLIGWTKATDAGGHTYGRGSYRWMAPELLDPYSDGNSAFARTAASDVYAFACTFLEAYTRKPPFSHIATEMGVVARVMSGERLGRPTDVTHGSGDTLPDDTWRMLEACSSPSAELRPSTAEVVRLMELPPIEVVPNDDERSSRPFTSETVDHECSARPQFVRVRSQLSEARIDARLDLQTLVLPITVLLADEDEAHLDTLSRFLQDLRIKHETVRDGANAVRRWTAGGIDLILMANNLSVMTGFTATREIRRLEQSLSVPRLRYMEGRISVIVGRPTVIIVAMIAPSGQAEQVEALAAGCNDFLYKPVDLTWLRQKVIEWGSMKALEKWVEGRADRSASSSPDHEIPVSPPSVTRKDAPPVATGSRSRQPVYSGRADKFRIEDVSQLSGSEAGFIRSLRAGSGYVSGSRGVQSTPLREGEDAGDSGEPFAPEASPQTGVVVAHPDGRPLGIMFHPRPRKTDA